MNNEMQRAVYPSYRIFLIYSFAYIRFSLLIYYANAGVQCKLPLYLFNGVTHCEKSINDSSRVFDSTGYRRIHAR